MGMKKYEVVKPVFRVNGGTIGLTPKQAQRRQTRLETKGKGVYIVTGAIEFKKGEVIGFDETGLSKAARASLRAVDKKPSASKEKKGTGNEAVPDAIAVEQNTSPIAD